MFDPNQLAEMMQKAQSMQAEMQADLERQVVEGQAGGGMVKIQLNGRYEAVGVQIDPAVIDPADKGMLEDLIRAALNDAGAKVQGLMMQQAQSMAGQMGIPGLG